MNNMTSSKFVVMIKTIMNKYLKTVKKCELKS